ncbi:hypothetical protein GGQ94_000693 [Petrimonas sulfuriphila]
MKLIKYLKEVVFFKPSQKKYSIITNEYEKAEYRIRILRQTIFISNCSIALGVVAIALSVLTVIIGLSR